MNLRGMTANVPVLLQCAPALRRKVRYVVDTLMMAVGTQPLWVDSAPTDRPWILYSAAFDAHDAHDANPHCVHVTHSPAAWARLEPGRRANNIDHMDGLAVIWNEAPAGLDRDRHVGFDLFLCAFYFLSSWGERTEPEDATRKLFSNSEFVRLGVPQDIVDRYLAYLTARLRSRYERVGQSWHARPRWPADRAFAVVLSHDVDYLPVRPIDNVVQGVKAIARHLLRHRDFGDASKAAVGLAAQWLRGRDPYGCVPEIISRERAMGVRSSFQVAVARRHPADVNYRIEDDRVRDYLRAIVEAGFDLCLHGSYRSTEAVQWYVDEARLLERRLARPLGSRQHYLSFNYDRLFEAQEEAGIEYDMSLGYPDHPGPRSGFSFPFFPYSLRQDRPYRVLQIGLFLMDVTLRGYMNLRAARARPVVNQCLAGLKDVGGCASVVWHPIVFGGARDPGYDRLYFEMIEQVIALEGWATDGRTVNEHWRKSAQQHDSFASICSARQ
jgi:hypothetical protein